MPIKNKKLILPVTAAAIVAVVGAGVMVSQSGLDKALVKQKLDESIVTIKEKGREKGRDIDIQYADVQVVGSLFSKRVVVQKPVFSIKPLYPVAAPVGQNKPDALVITTDQFTITPRAVDLSSATVAFDAPINVAAQDKPEISLLKIESAEPIAVTVTQKMVDNVPHAITSHTAPSSLTLTYLREQNVQGVEDAAPQVVPVYETLAMSIGAGSTIESDMTTDSARLGVVDVDYKKISLVPKQAPEQKVDVDAIRMHWSNQINEKKLNVVGAKMDIGPITADTQFLRYSPVALTMDFGFEGKPTGAAMPADGSAPQDATVTLKNFALTTKESGLTASANFVLSPSDMLPAGTANVKLTNLPYVLAELRTLKLLNPATEARFMPLIDQVAGVPVASITDLDVPIKRDKGSSFMIGKSSFEQLFALLLTNSLRAQPPTASGAEPSAPVTPPAPVAPQVAPQSRALVPQLPPADKAKLAPIPVPDNGVRG